MIQIFLFDFDSPPFDGLKTPFWKNKVFFANNSKGNRCLFMVTFFQDFWGSNPQNYTSWSPTTKRIFTNTISGYRMVKMTTLNIENPN